MSTKLAMTALLLLGWAAPAPAADLVVLVDASTELPWAELHPYLVLNAHKTQCAVSRQGAVPVAELDRAITGLVADGGLDKLLARYR